MGEYADDAIESSLLNEIHTEDLIHDNKPNKVNLKDLKKRLDEAIKNPNNEIINIGS